MQRRIAPFCPLCPAAYWGSSTSEASRDLRSLLRGDSGQENTLPLHRHPQEEMVIIKEGTIEVNSDGRKQVVG
jgi:hypothetical protein